MYEKHPNALWVEAHEVDIDEKLKVTAAVQYYVDQSISNTGNFSSDKTVEDVEKFFMDSYDLGIKGLTVFVDNEETVEKRGKILTDINDNQTSTIMKKLYEGDACRIDPNTGLTKCD